MTQKIKNRLNELISYLQPRESMSDSHMVDFFTNDAYNSIISSSIRQEIDNMGLEKSLNFIFDTSISDNCPNLELFLLESRRCTIGDICLSLVDFERKLIDMGCKNLSGMHLEMFMNSKKSHEVEIMSEISSAVCEISNTEFVADIGDGKGYLSSALALHSGLKVLGIDSSNINTQNAAKRLEKLNKVIKHNNSTKYYKQCTAFVTENTNLINLYSETFQENIESITLVGLHTCGSLSNCCLKIFVKNPSIKSICNVGCCYHLISDFPISKYLKNKNFQLSRNSRMLACQSLDRILSKKELPSKILFFRSLLQIILLKYCPDMIDKHVGKLKTTENFLEYVRKALKKFNCNVNISDEEINNLYLEYLPFVKHLQIFYLFRAHLAPVIESIILLDRLLYLKENVENAYLIKVFDPVISPRCYNLVAFQDYVINKITV